MPYNVPNGSVVPSVDLSEPDNGDFQALGYHRTGVISGGGVTQNGTPNMTVLVAAAEIIIEGVPYTKASGPVVLDPAGPDPRFDLIVWEAIGTPKAIKGTPSATNPVYPSFDSATQCLTAAVLVSSGVLSITQAYIVQKQVTLPRSLQRAYSADSDTSLEFGTPSKANSFKVLADGTISWVTSVLRRTADTALEWATSLTMKQNLATDKILTLKAHATAIKGNNVLELQPSSSTTVLAALDAIGLFTSANIRSGTGSPNGVVLADRPALYLDASATTGDTTLYVKTTDGATTGWVAMAQFSVTAQAIPVGTILPWPGQPPTDPLPAGYLLCDGSEVSYATYVNLNVFCGGNASTGGTKFGSAAAGNFKLPDYRGKVLMGATADASFPLLATNLGNATMTLTEDELPAHTHEISDETHSHPEPGRMFYQVEQAYMPSYCVPHNTSVIGAGAEIEPVGFDHSTMTMMSAAPTGLGQSFSLYQPSQTVNWLIKT